MAAEPSIVARTPASTTQTWRLAHENGSSWRQPGFLLDLFAHLVRLELRLLYKRSKLGIAWTLVNPIVQLVVFTVIFQRVLAIDVPFYVLFLCCGLLCWNAFSESLAMAAGCIVNAPNVLYQPGFRPCMMPVIVVAVGLIQFALSLSILAVLLAWYRVVLGWPIVALPLVIGIQALLILALAYPLAALAVRFDDVKHLLSVTLRFLFFLSPVLYTIDAFSGSFRLVFAVNPLTHLMEAYRAILVNGAWPDWPALTVVATGSSVALLFGFRYFQSRRFGFIEDL